MSTISLEEYLIRPAKSQEKITILQLLLNKSNKASLWFGLGTALVIVIVYFLTIIYLIVTLVLLPTWDALEAGRLQVGLVLNLSLVLLLFLILPLYGLGRFAASIYKKANPDRCLVAVQGHKIVGFVSLIRRSKQDLVNHLFVKFKYRQQGIGTKLLQAVVASSRNSVYVHSVPLQSSFYTRLGFEKYQDKNYRSSWLNNNISERLVLSPHSQILKLSSSDKSLFSHKYIVQKAEYKDIKTLCSLLLNISDNSKDSLLPFGFNMVFRLSLPFCLLLAIAIVGFLVALLLTFNLPSFVTIAIAIAIIYLSLVLPQKITAYIITKQLSQFYLIKAQDKIIGYGRLSRKRQYSILHHIYCFAAYGIEPVNQAIEYFSQRETQPIYVTCPCKMMKFYYQSGFIPIRISELPIKLQLGGKVSVKFGNAILVLWS